MFVKKYLFIIAAVLGLMTPPALTQAQQLAALDVTQISGVSVWTGTFEDSFCRDRCLGAARLKFNIVGGQVVSVEAAGKIGKEFYNNSSNPNLALNIYGTMPVQQIVERGGYWIMVWPGDTQVSFRFEGPTRIVGTIDRSLHPDRRKLGAVTFTLSPLSR